MEWVEVETLPMECQDCQEEECYNCDHAGKQWQSLKEDALRLRRKGLVKAIERFSDKLRKSTENCVAIENKSCAFSSIWLFSVLS